MEFRESAPKDIPRRDLLKHQSKFEEHLAYRNLADGTSSKNLTLSMFATFLR